MKLTKKIIAEMEQCGCSVSDEGDYYEIYVDNSCDEDYTFSVDKDGEEVEAIISYCNGFDAGEHFKMWYGVGRGEPSDPRTLLENCEEIEENLTAISHCLRKYC